MAQLDRLAAIVAARHAEGPCATVFVDSMEFHQPAYRGELLVMLAACNRAWGSSMEIGVKVFAEGFPKPQRRHMLSAYFTFVGLNDKMKPQQVPLLVPETAEEKRRYEEADLRRQRRRSR